MLCSVFGRDSSGEPRKLELSGKGEFDMLTPSPQRSPRRLSVFARLPREFSQPWGAAQGLPELKI
jgi:hypothetical protein